MKRFAIATTGTLRRRALDAALGLVERGGVEALQLRLVAAEVGSGVASLYYHFANKDALLAAVATEGWRELARRIDDAMAAGRYPRKIDAASAALLGFIRRRPHLYALMQKEAGLAVNLEVRAAEAQAFQVFQSALLGDERAPADRVDDIARVFWVLGRGIAASVSMQDDAEAARELEHAVLRGLAFLLAPRAS